MVHVLRDLAASVASSVTTPPPVPLPKHSKSSSSSSRSSSSSKHHNVVVDSHVPSVARQGTMQTPAPALVTKHAPSVASLGTTPGAAQQGRHPRSSLSASGARKSVVCAGSQATMRAPATDMQQQLQQPQKQQQEQRALSLSRMPKNEQHLSESTCVQHAVGAPCLLLLSLTCLQSGQSVCATPASALSCVLPGQDHPHVR